MLFDGKKEETLSWDKQGEKQEEISQEGGQEH